MTDKKDDGGSAFPVDMGGYTLEQSQGMSLRDYFAAKAMNGFIVRIGVGLGIDEVEKLVADSYAIADAMLEARKR